MAFTDRPHLAEVGNRHRLAAAGVVGDGHHDEWDPVGTDLRDRPFQGIDIHVSLEGVLQLCVAALGDEEVASFGSFVFDICPRRVEVGVGWHHITGAQRGREQEPFSRTTLMCRQDLPESGDSRHRIPEAVIRPAAGI